MISTYCAFWDPANKGERVYTHMYIIHLCVKTLTLRLYYTQMHNMHLCVKNAHPAIFSII